MHPAYPLPEPNENTPHVAMPPQDAEKDTEIDAVKEAARLPLNHRFQLGAEITPIQRAYLDRNGYLVFAQVASPEEVETIVAEVDRVQAQFLAEQRRKAYGVPLWFGQD